ncbi:MAG: hypothetical protein ACRDGA_03375, partial [Bacteroidota bacterium]
DGNAGYGNGRFAMDINVIWVPKALESTRNILAILKEMGFSPEELERIAPELRGTTLEAYVRHPSLLETAIRTWRGAARHFWVSFSREEIRAQVTARIEWLPDPEKRYWSSMLEKIQLPSTLRFLALSLDSLGKPIPIANTDPAMLLFLEEPAEPGPPAATNDWNLSNLIDIILLPYPVGLFVDRLGPLAANDAYASQTIWEEFRQDRYHSPYVVWGREVNLLLLGLTKQLLGSLDARGKPKHESLATYVETLRHALKKTLNAAEASGLKHNELWTYRIEQGKLLPVRYPTGSDIQLWNTTDLAVQFLLDRLHQSSPSEGE